MSEPSIQQTVEALLKHAKAAGADAADVLMVQSTDITVSQRLGSPEEMERAESQGVGLRVFVGEKNASATGTDLSAQALREMASRAVEMAKLSTDDAHATLAPQERLVGDVPDLDLYEADEPDIVWMREQCAIAEDAARAHDGITNSEGAQMGAAKHTVMLATSHGFARRYNSSSVGLSVCVLGGAGDKMERDYAYSSARFRSDVRAAADIGNEAAERTLRRLNPRKVNTQNVPVVFDPRVSKSLLGYVASAISGAAIARGTSFLKDKLGEPIFADGVTITDDPHRVRGLASKPFDGEGVATRKTNLVEGGVLKQWMLDVRSANQLGLETTGHASRGLGSAPSPSSTNLYMQPGTLSPDELIGEIDNGFYVTETFGMGVNLITGDYSQGAGGFWIENGQITYAVSEVTIAGQLLEMFKGVTPANDLRFDYGTNAPTIRIENMMLAGAAA